MTAPFAILESTSPFEGRSSMPTKQWAASMRQAVCGSKRLTACETMSVRHQRLYIILQVVDIGVLLLDAVDKVFGSESLTSGHLWQFVGWVALSVAVDVFFHPLSNLVEPTVPDQIFKRRIEVRFKILLELCGEHRSQ